MEFGNLLLDRLGFNREMLEAKLLEISTKEKEIRVLKKEVSGIMEHISKLESALNHGEHYYCGACCYLESKCNKGKYKCLEPENTRNITVKRVRNLEIYHFNN